MSTIRKRGPSQFQAIVRRHGIGRATQTLTTRKDAEKWAAGIDADMLRGAYISRDAARRTLLHDAIERYRSDVLPQKRGRHYEPTLRRLDEAFGVLSMAGVTSDKVAAFRDARTKAGKAASTVKKEIAVLSSIYKVAEREWGIPAKNPCTGIMRPREKNARTRRLEGDELARLLAECSPQLGLLVRFAIESAARLGELLGLRWSDVDAAHRVAVFRGIDGHGTKNGDAERAAPLSSEALRVLREVRALPASIDGRVFYWWKADDSLNKSWRRTCARAGVSDLRFHDLRHEATSRLFEKGVFQGVEVAAITGHKTLSMLKRYTHLRAEKLAQKLG